MPDSLINRFAFHIVIPIEIGMLEETGRKMFYCEYINPYLNYTRDLGLVCLRVNRISNYG
jgi:hypothetical protein